MRLATLVSAAAVAVLAVTSTPGSAQVAQDVPEKKEGYGAAINFATEAGNSDLFKVEASQLALERAQRPDVKGFARQLIDFHVSATRDLIAKSRQAGAAVPEQLDVEHSARLEKLSAARGPEFDRAYLDFQLAAHRESVRLLEEYARKGGDPGLKQFATRSLPVVERHRQRLVELAAATTTGTAGNGPGAVEPN